MKIGRIWWLRGALVAVAVCVANVPIAVGNPAGNAADNAADCQTGWNNSSASTSCTVSSISWESDMCKLSSVKCKRNNNSWNNVGDRSYTWLTMAGLENCDGNLETDICGGSGRWPP